MSEMIERVARAQKVAETMFRTFPTREGETIQDWAERRDRFVVRTGIEAMRKPTGNMITAGRAQIAYHIHPIDNVAPTWAAMISSALQDSDGTP